MLFPPLAYPKSVRRQTHCISFQLTYELWIRDETLLVMLDLLPPC